jgi:hypothetical protein
MSLTIPDSTKKVLDVIEAQRQPTVECQIAGKLPGLHQAEGLTDSELSESPNWPLSFTWQSARARTDPTDSSDESRNS